jgi:hypothetical protein
MHQMRSRLAQRLGRGGEALLNQVRRRGVATHEDTHLLALPQQPPCDHSTDYPRGTGYQDHPCPPYGLLAGIERSLLLASLPR